jgi:hypothetical protein
MNINDLILIGGDTPYLYKVTAITNDEISNKTETITFTEQTLVNLQTYFTNNRKFQYTSAGTKLTNVNPEFRQKIRTKQYIDADLQILTEE